MLDDVINKIEKLHLHVNFLLNELIGEYKLKEEIRIAFTMPWVKSAMRLLIEAKEFYELIKYILITDSNMLILFDDFIKEKQKNLEEFIASVSDEEAMKIYVITSANILYTTDLSIQLMIENLTNHIEKLIKAVGMFITENNKVIDVLIEARRQLREKIHNISQQVSQIIVDEIYKFKSQYNFKITIRTNDNIILSDAIRSDDGYYTIEIPFTEIKNRMIPLLENNIKSGKITARDSLMTIFEDTLRVLLKEHVKDFTDHDNAFEKIYTDVVNKHKNIIDEMVCALEKTTFLIDERTKPLINKTEKYKAMDAEWENDIKLQQLLSARAVEKLAKESDRLAILKQLNSNSHSYTTVEILSEIKEISLELSTDNISCSLASINLTDLFNTHESNEHNSHTITESGGEKKASNSYCMFIEEFGKDHYDLKHQSMPLSDLNDIDSSNNTINNKVTNDDRSDDNKNRDTPAPKHN